LGTFNCHSEANCINSIGSYECQCKPGFIGNGIECSPCPENQYSFDDQTCLSCPENSKSPLASSSITDCKCNSFNYYLDVENSICLPCEHGFLIDEDLNTCQSNFLFIHLFYWFIFWNEEKKIWINLKTI